MTTYFDTSAVVKLLVQEEDSAQARGLWDGASAAVTSRLAYPESRAALAAARRGGRLTKGSLDAAKRILDRVWAQVHVVELTSEIAVAAGDLAERFALRGYDAVHLASAISLGTGSAILATWDDDLAVAAGRAGLNTAPPRKPKV